MISIRVTAQPVVPLSFPLTVLPAIGDSRFSTPLLSNPVNSDFLDLEYVLAIN